MGLFNNLKAGFKKNPVGTIGDVRETKRLRGLSNFFDGVPDGAYNGRLNEQETSLLGAYKENLSLSNIMKEASTGTGNAGFMFIAPTVGAIAAGFMTDKERNLFSNMSLGGIAGLGLSAVAHRGKMVNRTSAIGDLTKRRVKEYTDIRDKI